MDAQTLRGKYTRELCGLPKNSRLLAWMTTFGFIAQIAISMIVGGILLSGSISLGTLVLVILLQIFIATRLRGLNNIVHECSHATFSQSRTDNTRIGKLCASLTLGCFADYRNEHLTHHMHLGDYEKDEDLRTIRELRLEEPLSPTVILRHFVTPFLGKHLRYYVRINLSEKDGRAYQSLKVAILFTAIAFSAIWPVIGASFLLLPYIFFYSTLNYWADCMDHAGLIHTGDDMEASRNIAAAAWLRWLFFPRYDSFHLVHHLFPQIPAHHLAIAHELLKKDDGYASHRNAVRRPATEIFAKSAARKPIHG